MIGLLHILAQTAAELAQQDEYDEVLRLVTETAREVTDASYASLGFVDGEEIEWRAAAGKPLSEVKGYRQSLDEGLCSWVVRHGRSRRVDDVTQEPDYFLQYAEMRSELDVPVKAGETVLGVLNVESPQQAAFTEEHEALLQILAGYVAIAMTRGA